MDYEIARKGWTEPARRFNEAIGHVSNYPLAYVYGLWLALSGDVIGRNAYVRYAVPIYPNHYICLVGDSAIHHKSTAVQVSLETLGDRILDEPPMTDISTSQGLLDELAGAGGKRLVYLDELASAAKRGKQDFAADVISKLVELYASPRSTGTHTRHNPIVVENVFLTLISCSTIEWLRSSVANTDLMAGFGNRMTFIMGEPRVEKSWPQSPWLEDFEWDKLDGFSGALKLDEQARGLWDEFFEDQGARLRTVSPFVRTLVARIPEKIIKAAIVQCAWYETQIIDLSILEAAIDWGKYVWDCVTELAPAFGMLEEQILQLIASGKITHRRQVMQYLSHSGHSARSIKDALTNLNWLGHVQDTNGALKLLT